MRGQPHGEADQRQAPAARAAQHPALYPLGFAAPRQEALEFEIGGGDRLERADAERLDPQLAAQGPNPAAAREQPVAGALDMQQDLGRNLAGLVFRPGAAAGHGASSRVLVPAPGAPPPPAPGGRPAPAPRQPGAGRGGGPAPLWPAGGQPAAMRPAFLPRLVSSSLKIPASVTHREESAQPGHAIPLSFIIKT